MDKTIVINYETFSDKKSLSIEDCDLIVHAEEAMNSAYAPYSKFSVGASVKLTNGTIIKGSNQENIAYPSGLCAERVALFYTGANYPNEQVETLCIVAKGDLVDVDTILSPCGGCRQVMVETEMRQKSGYRVIIVNQNDSVLIFKKASDILPLAFGL